jgi:hypothetical protein
MPSPATPRPCRLCGAVKELQESHILPGFVFRWMKETSATGYLRSRQQPNLRVQDGLKLHFLCADCERRFNQWETQFEGFPWPLADPGRLALGTTIASTTLREWLTGLNAAAPIECATMERDQGAGSDLEVLRPWPYYGGTTT